VSTSTTHTTHTHTYPGRNQGAWAHDAGEEAHDYGEGRERRKRKVDA
jgi:hypothetical protein